MASYFKRKDSPFYWVRKKRPDGVWCSESTRIRVDAPGALRKISKLVSEVQRDQKIFENEGGETLLANWVPLFFDRHCRSEKTRIRYINAWVHLVVYFKACKAFHPIEITYQMALEYVIWRTDPVLAQKDKRKPCKRNTALNELKVLSLILNESVRRGYIYANPVQKLGLKKDRPQEKREITKQEEEMVWGLLQNKDQWMRDSWVIALKQGCRLSEVQVPLKQIDFDSDLIRFVTKGERIHDAPLHPEVKKIALRRQKEKGKVLCVLPKKASNIWADFFDDIGLPEITFHCLRVTVVTRLARAGFSQAQTMQYVGHASEVVHAIYRKLKANDVRQLGNVL